MGTLSFHPMPVAKADPWSVLPARSEPERITVEWSDCPGGDVHSPQFSDPRAAADCLRRVEAAGRPVTILNSVSNPHRWTREGLLALAEREVA